MTFKVKYINKDWEEVTVDDWYYRYRYFAFRNYGDYEKLASNVRFLNSHLHSRDFGVLNTTMWPGAAEAKMQEQIDTRSL